MTPAHIWTVIAVIGFFFSGWNLISAWGDYKSGRQSQLNGMRRIATEAHVTLSFLFFLGSGLAGWIGIDAINAGAGTMWSRGVVILVTCVGCFLAGSIVLRIYRYRIGRYDARR